MTDAEILEKAIRKAMDGGWHPELTKTLWNIHAGSAEKGIHLLVCVPNFRDHSNQHFSSAEIVFNHEFAQAVWGTDKCDYGISGNPELFIGREWQLHLCKMALSEQPLKYLGENL